MACLLLAAMPATGASAAGAAHADPGVSCALLAGDGLDTTAWSRRAGTGRYECRSRYVEFLTDGRFNHRIRYLVRGDAQRADLFRLTLQIRARRDIQSAHRRLLEYTGALLRGMFDADPPAALGDAILAGAPGRWRVGGADVRLSRISFREVRYELRLEIRPRPAASWHSGAAGRGGA